MMDCKPWCDHRGLCPNQRDLPECSQCGTFTDDMLEDAISGEPWCEDCVGSGPDPDLARKQEKGE